MKCFNCGKETEKILCNLCIKEEILDDIFNQVLYFKEDNENIYIKEYLKSLNDVSELKNCIPDLLSNFDNNVIEYYLCKYYKYIKSPDYGKLALHYLDKSEYKDFKLQDILYDYIKFNMRDNYREVLNWCLKLYEKDYLYIEIYHLISEIFSMVGEYDLSENVINYARNILDNDDRYMFSNKDNMSIAFNKIETNLVRYKGGKPYWPSTEERREKIAEIYDEKGINYDMNSIKIFGRKKKKVKESEFEVKNIWLDDIPSEYVAFYCKGIYSNKTVITMCEIGAVKVNNGKIEDEFYDIVCPWEDSKIRKEAAKELNISLDEIEKSDEVQEAMKKFFEFAKDKLLVSTEGLGVQKNILTRAMRYAEYKSLDNPIGDILDYASNVDEKFDFENNTRDFLIKYFNLKEGNNSLEKAKICYEIVEKLRNM